MIILRNILILGCIFTLSYTQTPDNNISYIDQTHTNISSTVVDWSSSIDSTISSWLGNTDTNITREEVKKIENKRTKKPLSVDAFFQNHKYFDETDNSFIRVRTDSIFQTKESNDFNVRVSAQMPFNKTRQNFKLFVNDLNLDTAKNILEEDNDDNTLFSDIGVHYFAPHKYGINSRYSLGFSGISPFIRARYNMSFQMNQWVIDPVQTFTYSANDKFEEETNIYFDKTFNDLSLFRLQLHRKTQTEVDGMDYALSMQYYWTYRKDIGFRLSQSFFGNTKYPYVINNAIEYPITKTYGGINNYVTSFGWRENVWRKWFYYEIVPTVNFHKDHDFEANYSIRVFFDFYFGEYD